jgi:hypothetical protein
MQKKILLFGIIILLIGVFFSFSPAFSDIDKNANDIKVLLTLDSSAYGMSPRYQTEFQDLTNIQNSIVFVEEAGNIIFVVGIILVMCGFGLPSKFEKRIRKE